MTDVQLWVVNKSIYWCIISHPAHAYSEHCREQGCKHLNVTHL